EGQREVVLPRDLRCLLDPDLRHDVAADVHSEDLPGSRLDLVAVGRELDAARLAATADQHLRLDDDGVAELLGGCPRLGRARRQTTVGDRDAVAPEEILPLVLVQVQGARESTASIRPDRRLAVRASGGVSRTTIIVLLALGATVVGFLLASSAERLRGKDTDTAPSAPAG